MPKFEVRSVDWSNDWNDASEFRSYDAEDAVGEWCRWCESHGDFTDGYPQGLEVEVRSEDGTIQKFSVSTDFEPSYFVAER